MIPYSTIKTIDIGFLKLHVWGIFAALGFLAAILIAAREARRRKLDEEVIYDAAPWVIIGSVIGARIVFLLENPWAVSGPLDIISVWNGGLAFHGGLFGGILAFLAYVKRKKISLWKYADAIAPAIAVGHAIGRIGCFATGLHIGRETSVPWAVMYEGKLRHATPLYEFLGLIGIFAFLLWLGNRKMSKSLEGIVFAAYVASYSLLRFAVEFYREDPTYYGLTIAQYLAIGLFLASLGFILLKIRRQTASAA